MTDAIRPCPECASPNLTRFTHHNDGASAIQCQACGFAAATEADWNGAKTVLSSALDDQGDGRIVYEAYPGAFDYILGPEAGK